MPTFQSRWLDWEPPQTPIQRGDKSDKSPGPTEEKWDAETAALIEWFLTTSPPRAPFTLTKAVVVAHPARWWEALRRDIAAGPHGPRARYGALQQDLRRLAALMKSRESAKP